MSTATIPRPSPTAIEAARTLGRPTLIAARPRSASARRPRPAPTRRTARRSAPRRSPAPASSSAGTIRPSRFPPTFSTPGAAPARLGRQARPTWEKRLAAADAELRAEFERRIARRTAGEFRRRDRRLQEEALRRQAEGRHPQILRDGAGGHQRRGAGNHRRLGRPDRLQQHQDQPDQGDRRRRLRQPLCPLRHPRARHGGGA